MRGFVRPAPGKKLRLYVWEDVFSDHTPGIAFALATSAKEARNLIAEDSCNPEDAKKELRGRPRVFSSAIGFAQGGGG